MLRLTTFGGVGVREQGTGDAPETGLSVSRRPLALLVLVATSPGAAISRDKAMALLWSESDDVHARNALRQTLHTLKRELGDRQVILSGETLRLNPAVITSDVAELEALRAAGRLDKAAELYRGPFLDGFHAGGAPEFERWMEETRGVFGSEIARILESLARDAAARGEAAAAATWWRRLVALDPFNSGYALALMQALVQVGDRVGALRLAQAHAALMRQELGSGPDPAVAAFASQLRSETPLPAEAPAASPPSARGGSSEFLARLREELEGRYRIAEQMEQGRDGAARLVRARDLRHDRDVILKVVHRSLASMLDVERFLREIKLTARLRHPYILPLLDSGEIDGRPWYALPELGGITLRSRLMDRGALTVEESVCVLQDIAEALDHAHRHEVVHRDVSPENIALAEGHAVLTNMGVARALDAAAGPNLTETGILVGSPAYMSPEQAVGGGALDGRSDQYSLACVVFEMLVGDPLFSGPTPQAIMAKRAAHRPVNLGRDPALSPPVAAVLGRALAPAPAQRFSTTGEFAAALTTALVEPVPQRPRWLGWLGLG